MPPPLKTEQKSEKKTDKQNICWKTAGLGLFNTLTMESNMSAENVELPFFPEASHPHYLFNITDIFCMLYEPRFQHNGPVLIISFTLRGY